MHELRVIKFVISVTQVFRIFTRVDLKSAFLPWEKTADCRLEHLTALRICEGRKGRKGNVDIYNFNGSRGFEPSKFFLKITQIGLVPL